MANFETDLLIEVESGGNFGGTDDYRELKNKPVINGVVLEGVKSSEDLGLLGADALNGYDTSAQVDEKIKDFVTGVQVQDMIDESLSDYTPGSPAPAPAQSYNELVDKPSIDGVEMSGARTAHEYGLATEQQVKTVSDRLDGIIIPHKLPTPQQLTLKNNLTGDTVRFDGSAAVGFEFPELYLSGEAAGSPVGEIIPYLGKTAPDNYLICDGTEYDIADYPYLVNFIRDNYGSVNYFGGDGTETFMVPDLRGEFLRGSGAAVRDTGSGAEVGVHQDGTQITTMAVNNNGTLMYGVPNTDVFYTSSNFDKINTVPVSGERRYLQSTYKTTSQYPLNCIPRVTNTAVNWCIKYRPTFYLNAGHTYSLEERRVGTWIDGKPLYEKTVDFGALPNASTKQVAHGIIGVEKVWVYQVITDFQNEFGNTGGFTWSNSSSQRDNGYNFYPSKDNVLCQTMTNRESQTAVVIIRYTKSTDTAGAIPGGYQNNLTLQNTPSLLAGGGTADNKITFDYEPQSIGTWPDGKEVYMAAIASELNYPFNDRGISRPLNVDKVISINGTAKIERADGVVEILPLCYIDGLREMKQKTCAWVNFDYDQGWFCFSLECQREDRYVDAMITITGTAMFLQKG